MQAARIVYRTMKGIVFREFGELVTARFGEATWDALITESKVASGGAYTAVGTYPHEEAVALLMALSRKTGVAPDDLLRAFGEHLFGVLAQRFPFAVAGHGDLFAFLASLEGVVHVEVRKLYPDAELPSFVTRWEGDRFVLEYRSQRPFASLAEGLLRGAITHWGGRYTLARRALGSDGSREAIFELGRT